MGEKNHRISDITGKLKKAPKWCSYLLWGGVSGAVMIVALIVTFGSNPGGGSDGTEAADSAAVTETADPGTATKTAESSTDSVMTPEDFANVTIQSREEFGSIFSLETIETQRSFLWDSTAYDLVWPENNGDYVYEVFKALSDGNTSQEYTKYTDPVTSAAAILHLGEGSGVVTETLYKAKQQYNFSDDPGEGSVVNVRYTFTADGSFIDIPMVLAEETQQMWFVSFGDMSKSGDPDKSYGPLEGDICTRNVYAEYELNGSEQYRVTKGSYTGEDNIGEREYIQVSGFGIYRMDEKDSSFGCIHAERLQAEVPADVTAVRTAYRTSEAYNVYQADQGLTEESFIKVYYLTDPDASHLGTDAWMPVVLREYDLSTGAVTDRALPEDLQVGTGLQVDNGYYDIYHYADPDISILLPLISTDSLYAGKSWEELEGAVDGSYAANRGMDILAYPGVVFDVSERTEDETFVLLDLDGDGFSEKISLHPADTTEGYSLERYLSYVNQGLWEMNCYDLGEAVLEVNGQATEIIYTSNMNNSIFAFSPDGKQILIALYEDGPSADSLTRLYRYQNGKLVESGQIQDDIRDFRIQDGQIAVTEPYWAVQTDSIHRIYRVTATGQLKEVPQEEYILGGWTEVELLQDMTLYRTPDGETFVLPAGSKARMTMMDATQNWICLHGEDNTEGWFRLENDSNYGDYFSGLNLAD